MLITNRKRKRVKNINQTKTVKRVIVDKNKQSRKTCQVNQIQPLLHNESYEKTKTGSMNESVDYRQPSRKNAPDTQRHPMSVSESIEPIHPDTLNVLLTA